MRSQNSKTTVFFTYIEHNKIIVAKCHYDIDSIEKLYYDK